MLARAKPALARPPPQPFVDQSTTVGKNNRGTVAPVYNNVINQAPPPKVVWEEKTVEKVGDGFRTDYRFLVDSPYPASSLFIEVHGGEVRDLEVRSQGTGIQMIGWSGQRETHAFTTLQNAKGKYRLSFTSANADSEVRYGFED